MLVQQAQVNLPVNITSLVWACHRLLAMVWNWLTKVLMVGNWHICPYTSGAFVDVVPYVQFSSASTHFPPESWNLILISLLSFWLRILTNIPKISFAIPSTNLIFIHAFGYRIPASFKVANAFPILWMYISSSSIASLSKENP